MKNKVKIREEMIKRLRAFDSNEKARQTKIVLSNLTALPSYKNAGNIGLYMHTPIEFDLTALFDKAGADGKRILIPKTLPGRAMSFIKFDSGNLARTKFGLLEPLAGLPEIPDLIVVPGLAWNEAGYRVGFGAGYYDRYLADYVGPTLSLVYDIQFSEEFAPEAHDIAVKEIFSV